MINQPKNNWIKKTTLVITLVSLIVGIPLTIKNFIAPENRGQVSSTTSSGNSFNIEGNGNNVTLYAKPIDSGNKVRHLGDPTNERAIINKNKNTNDLGLIIGQIIDRKTGDNIQDAEVLIISDTFSIAVRTNKDGIFSINLPKKMQLKNEDLTYKLSIKKDGFDIYRTDYYPLSGNLEIQLDRTKQ